MNTVTGRTIASVLVAAALVAACSSAGATSAPTTAPSRTAAPTKAPAPSTSAAAPSGGASGSSAASGTCPTAQPAPLPKGQTRTVTLETSKGKIAIKVDGGLSPIAAGNFVALAQCGYYTGVVFHRLVPQFVIQGGDGQYGRVGSDGKLSAANQAQVGRGGPGYTIKDEAVTTQYRRGTVAMARTPAPDSQGSQFFIVLDDGAAPALAQANTYAIFGTVTSGMEVVDAIAAMPNGGEAAGNPALDPVPMTKVTVSNP